MAFVPNGVDPARNSGLEVPQSKAFRRHVVNAMRASRFEAREFADTREFLDQPSLLEFTLRHVIPNLGCWVELGVGSGESTRQICAIAERLHLRMTLHGFDSFMGLPEDWGGEARQGDYAFPMPQLSEPNVRLYPGWFHETLPTVLPTLPSQIGFMHVDCDLYSSTRTALRNLCPRLGPGTVLQFDEYWNYLEAGDGEMRAFKEFVAQAGLGFEYLGYNANYMQASVVLTGPGRRAADESQTSSRESRE